MQSLVVVGGMAISMVLAMKADKIGRANTLVIISLLQSVTPLIFTNNTNYNYLTTAGILGILSLTGEEIGAFMIIEK